jgi:pimeloyl-ACP methyl ester carboxylesterase
VGAEGPINQCVGGDDRRRSAKIGGNVRPLTVVLMGALLMPAAAPTGAQIAPEDPRRAGDLFLVPYLVRTDDGRKVIPGEFGRLVVPVDRRDVGAGLAEVAFVRLRSTSPRPGAPIVYLAGGPGSSGIANLRQGRATTRVLLRLREVGDVIVVDQRGTGLSVPTLGCPGTVQLALDAVPSAAEVGQARRQSVEECAAFWRAAGVSLAGYNSEQSADDIADIREALGYERMSLIGGSYGSHLGLIVLRRHGREVDRTVFTGIHAPSDYPVYLPSALDRQLLTVHEAVKADSALSRHIPDFLALVRELGERLDRAPAQVRVKDPLSDDSVTIVVGKRDLHAAIGSGLGLRGYRGYILQLPANLHALSEGRWEWLGNMAVSWRRSVGGESTAMAGAMTCAAGVSGERLARVQREGMGSLLHDDQREALEVDECTLWGVQPLGDDYRMPVHSDVPTLLISGDLDAFTPPEQADSVMQGLSRGRHLLIRGGAHDWVSVFDEAPGVLDAVVEFLRGGDPALSEVALPLRLTPPQTVERIR